MMVAVPSPTTWYSYSGKKWPTAKPRMQAARRGTSAFFVGRQAGDVG
jgi:hypothetical protein